MNEAERKKAIESIRVAASELKYTGDWLMTLRPSLPVAAAINFAAHGLEYCRQLNDMITMIDDADDADDAGPGEACS